MTLQRFGSLGVSDGDLVSLHHYGLYFDVALGNSAREALESVDGLFEDRMG